MAAGDKTDEGLAALGGPSEWFPADLNFYPGAGRNLPLRGEPLIPSPPLRGFDNLSETVTEGG